MLPPDSLERITALDSAAPHPVAASGALRTLVLVFAPRNAVELDIVLSLVGIPASSRRELQSRP